MNTLSHLKKSFAVTLIFGLTLLASTFANSATTSSIQPRQPGVDNMVAGYGSNTDALLYAPPSYSLIPATQLAQGIYLLNTQSYFAPATNDTQATLASLITVNPGSSSADKLVNGIFSFGPNPIQLSKNYSSLMSKFSAACPSSSSNSPACQKMMVDLFQYVDLNSLLASLTYPTTQASSTARVFIDNVVGTLHPFETADFPSIANLSKQNITTLLTDNTQFLSDLRSYITSEGVVLSNLYQMFMERQPVKKPDPGSVAGQALSQMKLADRKPLPSALELETIMATGRLYDPNWHKSLLKDTSEALERQLVVLAAENLAETYKTRMLLERILATQSLQLQQTAFLARQGLTNAANNVATPPKK